MSAASKRHMGGMELRPVVGHEGSYEVSSDGRVFSVTRFVRHTSGASKRWPGREMRLKVESNGYLRVALSANGKPRLESVHRLVCAAFHGAPPSGSMHVNHKNGVKHDNRAENLEWVSASDNELHSYRMLGKKNAANMTGKFGAAHNRSSAVEALHADSGVVSHAFGSMREAERAGFCATRICACIKGRSATHKGFLWRLANG